ncbi:MAG: hypothetical protein U1E45_20675 [Geminicoccaceae bacterium]
MRRFAAVALAAVAVLQPALSIAQPTSPGPWRYVAVTPAGLGYRPLPPSQLVSDEPASEAFTEQTREGIACLVTGSVATGLAVVAGWQNVTNLMSGGIVNATTPAAVGLALFGVVFGSFCAIGQALTPVFVNVFDLPPPSPAEQQPAVASQPAAPGDASADGSCPECGPEQRLTIAFDGKLDAPAPQAPGIAAPLALTRGCASQIGPLSRYTGAC